MMKDRMVKGVHWNVWIDVGGTFTDCFVHRSGEQLSSIRSTKVLSSGRVPIHAQVQSSRTQIVSEDLAEPDGFWTGATLIVMDPGGEELQRTQVLESSTNVLRLSESVTDIEYLKFELDPGVEAPVLGVRRLLGYGLREPLPELEIRIGTTKGTNALLTRSGAKTALAITSPFEDLMGIGDQTRPDLFALDIVKPEPLAAWTLGVHERLDAKGNVLTPLDETAAERSLRGALEQGCTSLAICLMHAHVNPVHEQGLKNIARKVGFEHISVSSELAPLIEIVPRAQTSIVDAYLSPIVESYLAKLRTQFGKSETGDSQLLVMTSAGGLVKDNEYSGKDSILSGPAGGVAALQAIGKALGEPQLLGLDMGGTSTDVCRVAESPELQFESNKAGVRILVPTLPIETVASGGGSVCWFDGVSLRVGPQSAGAFPGPACYGRGGPLTVTDLNVYLGRVPVEQFPFPLDQNAIATRLQGIYEQTREIGIESIEQLAAGFRRIAIEQMAEAVRSVSIAQGADPRNHALVGFGGAAGQHICEIAEALEINDVIDVPHAGLLSALGMGLASERLDATLPVYQLLCDVDAKMLVDSSNEALSGLRKQLADDRTSNPIEEEITAELRYQGTDATLGIVVTVDQLSGNLEALEDRFHDYHQQRYGYCRKDTWVELVSLRLQCRSSSGVRLPNAYLPECDPKSESLPLAESGKNSFAILRRDELKPGDRIHGPCVVLNSGSTLCVDEGWQAAGLTDGTLRLQRSGQTDVERSQNQVQTAACDPVFRECYAARMQAIATQMGIVLQQTAVSVNVKQRRDFSCAVFDQHGYLLANAPHVPVHLGAMGQTVRNILRQYDSIAPGDSFITNDPYQGGSHLPDITVVTPVFGDRPTTKPVMFVANRAHHADIGGIAPGSMSISARTLGEEGVVISPRKLTDLGNDCLESLRALLSNSPYPVRNCEENLKDIAAQQAANQRGVELLQQYASSETWSRLQAYSEHLLQVAETRVRRFVLDRPPVAAEFEDYLEDGTPIRVKIESSESGQLTIDFEGTGAASKLNFNANTSIVSAAVMYVLRCLIADELPLNEGVLRCVDLRIPEGVLNPKAAHDPHLSPAVAAGNVETSQRIVDVLLAALGAAAASQGTMNNLLFGNKQFGFYETICGGAGATVTTHGASGVHTHMTNTRLTDPELLEDRYPVRLHRFQFRRGSGGAGLHAGGDGVEREIEFLEPVEVSLLTSRRGEYAPFGLAGGSSGAKGENLRIVDGRTLPLASSCSYSASQGERILIRTPGGGGFGNLP